MINWNLIKCALGNHTFNEPIRDDTLERIVKICKHCSLTIRTMHNLRLNSRKEEIIQDVKEDRFAHAKTNLVNLLRELGY